MGARSHVVKVHSKMIINYFQTLCTKSECTLRCNFSWTEIRDARVQLLCLKKPSTYSVGVGESWLAMTISDFLEFQRRLGIFFMPQRKENSHLHQRGGPSSRNISLAFRTGRMRTAKQPIIIRNRTFHTQPSHSFDSPLHYYSWLYAALWESLRTSF